MSPSDEPKSDENIRQKRVSTYLTESEYEALKNRSETYGVSMSDLVRTSVLGLRVVSPPSTENVQSWMDVGRIASNLNQSTRALNAISRRIEQLFDTEVHKNFDPELFPKEVIQIARNNANLSANLVDFIADIRALLMGQWTDNIENSDALHAEVSGRKTSKNEGDQA